MELTFFRHGIAVDRDDPHCPVDAERRLTIEGKNKVEAGVRGLKALAVRPELVLTSPYLRCAQTAALAVRGLDLPKRALVETEALLPDADPRALWRELAARPKDRVLVVGHGEALEPIAGLGLGFPLEDGPDGRPTSLLARRALHLKKAGALHLELPSPPTFATDDLASPPPTAGAGPRLVWLVSARLLRQIGRG